MTAEKNKGAEASTVVLKDQEDLDGKFAADEIIIVGNLAIPLSVPGSTSKDATKYTSTLTWKLTTNQ